MKRKISHNQKGFTIVETLVSLTIFTIALVGLLSITGRGISDTTIARNRMTANFLAQEGLESVRAIRDTLIQRDQTNGWGDFTARMTTANCEESTGGCDIDPLSDVVSTSVDQVLVAHACTQSPPPNNCTLRFDSSTGYYGYLPATNGQPLPQSVFTRIITIDPVNGSSDPNERVVTVKVHWNKGLHTEETQVTENLYNWF